ncbi:uncharacterized protein LOC110856937 [Folsomia candida]|uniref:uncharacterized protein LOC110856937 n=1 Tax=Folsomia candida TaxID=158441 RepID=UPI000B8F874E|nr:uncharacterized protein LOC110856937 [Folsomia candida]
MNAKLIFVTFYLVGSALSQSAQPVQPVSSDNNNSNNGKSEGAYPTYVGGYRTSSHPIGGSSSPSVNYQPSSQQRETYPATTSSFSRDSYGTSRDASGGGNPIFGVSSDANFQLSAYFGQIFWGFVTVSVTLVVAIWVIRFFSGTDVVGGFFNKIKDSSATGKSLDLDGVTNMVYDALESYGKWAAKEVRHAVDVNSKGRY